MVITATAACIGEFLHNPYKARCFVKYNITSYWPKEGVIKASVGDTINFRVETNLAAERKIGREMIHEADSSSFTKAAYCLPLASDKSNMVNYSYIVRSPDTQWIQLIFNDDMILRYKLDVRNNN
jgi:hypothetical protein